MTHTGGDRDGAFSTGEYCYLHRGEDSSFNSFFSLHRENDLGALDNKNPFGFSLFYYEINE